MIFGKNENGKKSQKLNNSKIYNEMILCGKGLPPIGTVKPKTEEEKRIEHMILNGQGLPPLKEESGIKLIKRK